MEPCKQTKCDFRKGSPFEHMCPRCAECDCPPHEINNDCVECCCCESDEGSIRAGKPDGQTQDQKMIIEVKQ